MALLRSSRMLRNPPSVAVWYVLSSRTAWVTEVPDTVQADPVAKIAALGINAVIARLEHIQGEGSTPWANASRISGLTMALPGTMACPRASTE